jgi:hypothetical protein
MLLIDDFVAVPRTPEVEYDSYTPVTITWPRYRALSGRLLTRIFGDAGRYLEVKADPETGELVEVVLISAEASVEDHPAQLPSRDDHELIVPQLDLAATGSDLSPPAETTDLTVIAYPELLEIRFPLTTEALVGAGPVRFGVASDGALSALRIDWHPTDRDAFIADFAKPTAS